MRTKQLEQQKEDKEVFFMSDKKYKVLLVEDNFYVEKESFMEQLEDLLRKKVTSKSFADDLKSGLEKKLNNKADIDITPRVVDALENIAKKEYDLVITDVNLDYVDKDGKIELWVPYKHKSSKIREIHDEAIKVFKEQKKTILSEIKEMTGEDLGQKLSEKSLDEISNECRKLFDAGSSIGYLAGYLLSYYVEAREYRRTRKDEYYLCLNQYGLYIHSKAKKKFLTKIFTSINHLRETEVSLIAYGSVDLKEGMELLAKARESSEIHKRTGKWPDHDPDYYVTKTRNVYAHKKDTLDDFAYVIGDALQELKK